MDFKKQVTLIIKSGQEFIYKSEALELYQIHYHPSFDINDFFAGARLLYEIKNSCQITTLEQYVTLLRYWDNNEYQQLLSLFNEGKVLKSSLEEKIILIEYDAPFGFKSNAVPDILTNNINVEYPKRFALLITEPLYRQRLEVIMESLHLGIYKEPNENWEVHIAVEKKYPNLIGLDGLIITGSSSDAYTMVEDWKESLKQFIIEVGQHKTRTIGICFGHQILAHYLGGETQKMLHVPLMQVSRKLVQSSIEWNGEVYEKLNVYQAHGDYVVKLPENAKLIMSADHCQNYAFQTDYSLGLQFHPEFNGVMLLRIIHNVKDDNKRQLMFKECYDSLNKGEDQQYLIWDFLLKFLKQK